MAKNICMYPIEHLREVVKWEIQNFKIIPFSLIYTIFKKINASFYIAYVIQNWLFLLMKKSSTRDTNWTLNNTTEQPLARHCKYEKKRYSYNT